VGHGDYDAMLFLPNCFASIARTYHHMIASVKHTRCIVDKTRAFVNLNESECLMCPLSPLGLKDDCQHAWVHKPSRRQPVSVLMPPIMADKKPELQRPRTIHAKRIAVEQISRQEALDDLTLMEGAKPMKETKASCQLRPAPPSRPSSRGSNVARGVLGTPGDDWEPLERSGTSTLIGQRIVRPRARSPPNVASKRQRGTVKGGRLEPVRARVREGQGKKKGGSNIDLAELARDNVLKQVTLPRNVKVKQEILPKTLPKISPEADAPLTPVRPRHLQEASCRKALMTGEKIKRGIKAIKKRVLVKERAVRTKQARLRHVPQMHAKTDQWVPRRWFAIARSVKRKSHPCACTGNCTLGCPAKRRCSRMLKAPNRFKCPNEGVVFHYKGVKVNWLCEACSCDRMECSSPARLPDFVSINRGAIAGLCTYHNRINSDALRRSEDVRAREGA
jgi:hypothetical protein